MPANVLTSEKAVPGDWVFFPPYPSDKDGFSLCVVGRDSVIAWNQAQLIQQSPGKPDPTSKSVSER